MPRAFFAVSGVAAARTKPLYDRLQIELPKRLVGNQKGNIHFIGNPFKPLDRPNTLPFPLLWRQAVRDQHPTTRLFDCWRRLNEFCVTQLRPLLADPEAIIICKRFGLDALLYATAIPEQAGNQEAIRLHHDGLVPMRVVEQSISPPIYLIPRPNPDTIYDNLCRIFAGLRQRVDEQAVIDFITHEAEVMRDYFDQNRKHKQTARFLMNTEDIDGPVEQAIGMIMADLRNREPAAA